jgi:hypothetical protein
MYLLFGETIYIFLISRFFMMPIELYANDRPLIVVEKYYLII